MNFLTLVGVVKDEVDLPEWIAYHLAVGVERFLIYDNGSRPELEPSRILKPYIDRGQVTVFRYEGNAMQFRIYTDALRKGREAKWGAKWFAFLDADEFLLPMESNDVRTLLAACPYAGFAAHWKLFGSGGREERHEGLLIDAYTRCEAGIDRHIKSIVDPAFATHCYNAHFFPFSAGRICADEQGRTVIGPFGHGVDPSGYRMRINHYRVKSKADQAMRLERGAVDIYPDGGRNGRIIADIEARANETECRLIQRFGGRVREIMALAS